MTEQRRTTFLAFAALTVLVVIVIVVAVVAHGGDHPARKAADQGLVQATSALPVGTLPSVPAAGPTSSAAPLAQASNGVLTSTDLGAAHTVMHTYLTGIGTYTYASSNSSWQPPLLALTDGSSSMRALTVLPTGRAGAQCAATHCSSTAVVTITSDSLVADSQGVNAPASVTSLATVSSTVTADAVPPQTLLSHYKVTAVNRGTGWVVSSLLLEGVGGDIGDAGAGGPAGD